MKIKLDSVCREFEITARSTPDNQIFVFDSFVHEPGVGTTKFSRYIDDSFNSWKDTVVVMDDDRVIGSGEDPRAFMWRGSPCCSAQTFNAGHGFINKIYVKNLDKWLILIPPDGIAPGKNWTPFVREDELYFIHGFSPFRVLKAKLLSENDGFLVLDTVAEHSIRTPQSFDNFSRYRGGANALQFGDLIVGIGHTNELRGADSTTMIHRPFVYVYKPDQSVTYCDFDFEFPDTYNIVDPTAFYLQDGTLFLTTCETELVWDLAGQKGRICRYSLEMNGDLDENSFGFGGRRLHRWSHDDPPERRRFLGAWRRS